MIWVAMALLAAASAAASVAVLGLRRFERLQLARRMGEAPPQWIPQPVMLWLRRRREHPLLVKKFPFVIDMLCLALDAGLDFTSAIARMADQMPQHPMGQALHRLLADIRLGRTRAEALRRFRVDVDLPAATRLSSLLIQADRLGAPIAALLREEAKTLRFDRFQSAERLGQAAAQKLLFPLVFCIMPVVFLVIFGPLFVQISQSGLDGLMGGGL